MCDAIAFPLISFSFVSKYLKKGYTMMERCKVNHNIKCNEHTREHKSKKGLLWKEKLL